MYLLLSWVVFYTLVNWMAAIYLFCFSPEGAFIGQLSPFDMLCMREYDYDFLSKENGIILSVSPVLVRMESLNISIPAPHAFSHILHE